MQITYNAYNLLSTDDRIAQIKKIENDLIEISWNSDAHFSRYEIKNQQGQFLGFLQEDTNSCTYIQRRFIDVDKASLYVKLDDELHTLEIKFFSMNRHFERSSFYINEYELISLLKKVQETHESLTLTFFEHRYSYKGTPMRIKKTQLHLSMLVMVQNLKSQKFKDLI